MPFEQAWELYHNSFSLCSKKLRVCLDELNLPYRSHPIDLIETGSYQNVSREFLAINPAGTVPVLIHEGHPIYESHDQIVYAAMHAHSLGAQLLPEDPERRSVVDAWVDKAALVGDPMRARRACRPLCSRPYLPLVCHDCFPNSDPGNPEGPFASPEQGASGGVSAASIAGD